jgi:transposase-like protein
MRFGVIVCPKCKQVKGIALSSKTTRCIRCGKTLQVSTLKIFYETDSEEKLRQMIGVLNAEMAGDLDAYKKIFCNQ